MTVPELPSVPAGTIVCLAPGEWRYGLGDLRLKVARVRAELAPHYGGEWVWVEGDRLAPDGSLEGRDPVLVKTEALARAVDPRPGSEDPASTADGEDAGRAETEGRGRA